MSTWYVIQVITGQERAMAELIERVADAQTCEECFFPQFETEIKVRGAWVRIRKPLFPGYIIAVSRRPEELVRQLRQMPQFARLLAMGEQFVPLAKEEVELIGGFTSKGDRVVPMSMGVKVGVDVVVTEGPLKGHEGLISEINRRKSTAYLQIQLCGRIVTARVGLGVLSAGATSEVRALQAARADAACEQADERELAVG